jgi:hypothetical protein
MKNSASSQGSHRPAKPEEVKNMLDARDLVARFRSKKDLYDYLLYQSNKLLINNTLKSGQYFMPARKKVTKDFLKLVFAGKKELIPQS